MQVPESLEAAAHPRWCPQRYGQALALGILRSTAVLTAAGFDARTMKGGIFEWTAWGLPTVAPHTS